MIKLMSLVLTTLFLLVVGSQHTVITTTTVGQLPNAATEQGRIQFITDGLSVTDCTQGGGSYTVMCRSNGTAWLALGSVSNGHGVPTGAILIINSGSCPAGYSEVSELEGRTLIGTLAANGNVGSTGGSDNITPAGTNSGGAVSAHSGTAVDDHASHNHNYTQTLDHQHMLATGTGSTGNFSQVIGTVDTSSGGTGGTPTQTALGTRSGNPVGSAGATGTTSGPSAPLTHNVSQPANHSFTQPSFTGTQFDNRSAFVRCIFCRKD